MHIPISVCTSFLELVNVKTVVVLNKFVTDLFLETTLLQILL